MRLRGASLAGQMLYAAKCYWPGVTRSDLDRVTERAADEASKRGTSDVAYRGSLVFSHDDLVLSMFEGPSRLAVMEASERARIPCERVMDSVWLGPRPGPRKGART